MTAILAACSLVIGCNRQSPTPEAATTAPAATAPATINTDPDKEAIPEGPVTGTVLGQTFKPDQVTVTGNELVFRQGSRFAGDYREVRLSFTPANLIREQSTVKVAKKDDDPPVSVLLHAFEPARVLTTQRAFGDGYTLRVEFAKSEKDRLAGRLSMRIVDEGRTHTISGRFKAVDVRNDPSGEAPGPIDTPYIYGPLAVQVKGAGRLGVGYIGRSDAGKQLSDQVSWTFSGEDSSGGVGTMNNSPRVTYISNDKEKTFRYYHVHLEPGQYLVYTKRDNTLANQRWIHVDAGTRLTLDLRVDNTMPGKLVVSLPQGPATSEVSIVPLDEKGVLPFPDEAARQLAFDLGTSTNAVERRAEFRSLPPGRYRVLAGKSQKDFVLEAGKTVSIELP